MNFKFKRLYHRVFSIFLVIVLSVLSVPTSAVAKEGNEEPLNISTSAPISDSTIATDLSQEVIWPVVSDEEAMRREQLIQNGYSPDDYSASEYKQMAARGELQPLAVYPAVLADGVYAIKNIGNSSGSTGFYLDTALAHWLPGYNMQQYKFENGTSPLDNFEVSTLFKITRNPSTGSYIIRIMRNNALSFGIRLNFDGSTEILSKKIPLDDSSVALTDTYSITVSGSGYKICKYGTTNLIAAKDTTASGAAGAPDSYLYASPEIGDHARWTFSAYTGPERNDITILGSGSLEVGKSSTLDPVFYSTRPGYNVVSLNMSQVPTSYYTLSGPSDYGIYSLTPHQGTAWNVGIYLKNGSSSTASSILVKNETWNITLPIDEGIYFFINKEVGKYMQIDNDDIPGHNTSGSIMELYDYDGRDYQKWDLVHIGDGYYKIISVKSGMALCVPSGSINEDEVALVQESYSNLNRKKWKITKSSSGAYILRPKSSEGYSTDWCMCAGDQFLGITDGLNVEQKAYVNNSNYKDEWYLEFDITSISTRLPNEDAQNKTKWCWAACSKMVGEHNGGDGALSNTPAPLTITTGLHSFGGMLFYGETSTGVLTADAGQREIVIDIHGNDDNNYGSNDNKVKALQLASINDMNVGTWGTGSLSISIITAMNDELSAGRWVIGNVFTNSNGRGHSIVIISYDATTQIYTFWDPWTDSNGTFTRTQLLNNTIHTVSDTADRTLAWVQYCN